MYATSISSSRSWLWLLFLVLRSLTFLHLPVTSYTPCYRSRIQSIVHKNKNNKEGWYGATTAHRELYMSTQQDSSSGTAVMEDVKSSLQTRPDKARTADKGTASSSSSSSEIGMKFTTQDLDNEIIYTLEDGAAVAMRKIQFLDEVQDCGVFTVRTFFDESASSSVVGVETNKEKLGRLIEKINPFRANNIEQLTEIQIKELASRLEHPYAAMFLVEDMARGEIIGFSEIFTQPFDKDAMRFKDPFPLKLTSKENLWKGMPKIANFCVHRDFRKRGVGKVLLSACLSQASEWGYEQALLLVDADNASARRFYRFQGFADVAYESGMRKYDVNTLRLSSVRSPKYLMQKPLQQPIR